MNVILCPLILFVNIIYQLIDKSYLGFYNLISFEDNDVGDNSKKAILY